MYLNLTAKEAINFSKLIMKIIDQNLNNIKINLK